MQKKQLTPVRDNNRARLKFVSQQLAIKERGDKIRSNCKGKQIAESIGNLSLCMIEDAVMKDYKFTLYIYLNFLHELLADIPFRGRLQLEENSWSESASDVLGTIDGVLEQIDSI